MAYNSTPLDDYLSKIYSIHASGTGVKETSYYPELNNLFNAIGKQLKPRVSGILNPKSKGAGIPDFGFYTSTQLKRGEVNPKQAVNPERGAVEAKGASQDLDKLAESAQVLKYLKLYRLVLITNLREFLLLEIDDSDNVIHRERYSIGKDEATFWASANHEQREATVALHNERLTEFLRRVLLYKAQLTSPEELARFLASYAREALARLEQSPDIPALDQLKKAMEQALGIRFDGDKGTHFFRSTLVQTLFYGVFSAWVLWSRTAEKGAQFDWRAAAWTLHVPMIRSLFEEISKPSTLKPLGIDEVLNWTAVVLNRVQRVPFFKNFQKEHAVQYFYEPFLQAFDPSLRKQLGVWYTPPEIVEYMVERVDRALRTELNLPDGLADPDVYVLDPACGTGAYLVEVVRRINRTLEEKGADALTKQDLKNAVRQRLYGFELLPAPFVVAHLQLGLLLQELGAPLDSKKTEERAAVYLTNALTGWEDKEGLPPLTGTFYPELRAEYDAAREVKRKKPILVVLGNPPYNAYAGTSPDQENGLVEPYKKGLISEWGIKKFNLDDLYVRFFRLAERRVAETTGRGVVCFVSNFSYLRDPSFVVMRQHLLGNFDRLWFDNLNGDSRETGKVTPTGLPDPSAFSTPQNTAGIRTGTAIGLLVRIPSTLPETEDYSINPAVRYRDVWGIGKREQLLQSLELSGEEFEGLYRPAKPIKRNRFSFRGGEADLKYDAWPSVVELSKFKSNGLMEKRGGALTDTNYQKLEQRFKTYFDKDISWESYVFNNESLTVEQSGFVPQKARQLAIDGEGYSEKNISKYSIRPFDQRWAYYTSSSAIWNRPRPVLKEQVWEGNSFFVTRPMASADDEGNAAYCTTSLGDNDSMRGHAYYFPVLLKVLPKKSKKKKVATLSFLPEEAPTTLEIANLSVLAREYLEGLGLSNLDQLPTASLIWNHALAIAYSTRYKHRHAAGIRQDWLRIPLPVSADTLKVSAKLGEQIAAILDIDLHVVGVSHSPVKTIQPFGRLDVVAPATEANLALTAGWGRGGHGKPVMPGPGRIKIRPYSELERQSMESLFSERGLDADSGYAIVGTQALDIYLNATTRWVAVPASVWEFTIGGYQILKKWLSYREQVVSGCELTVDEARYISQVVRRILSLLLLTPALDINYNVCANDSYIWPGTEAIAEVLIETPVETVAEQSNKCR